MKEIVAIYVRDGVTVQPLTHHMDAQGIADARLISAAPELLSALKAIAPMWDNDSPLLTAYGPEIEAARAAIAKAEGSEE